MSEGQTVFHDDTEVECIAIAENCATLNLERIIIQIFGNEIKVLHLVCYACQWNYIHSEKKTLSGKRLFFLF